MRDLNKAMKKLQEAKRLESTKLAKLVKESVVEPEDKEETFDNKFNYKVSLDNGKTITATCSKENIEDARKYFLGKSYLNTKTGEKAKIVGVEEINSDENRFEEIKNEEFGSTSKQLTDNDPAQKVPFDSDAKKDIEKAATQKPKIVAEEFGSENKDLTDNDPAQNKAFETETRKKMDDATKGKTIDDKIDESKKLNEATEEDINNENKLEKAKQLIEVIFNMDSLDETRRAAKQELKDLVYPQRIEPEKTEKKIVKESIFDNDEDTSKEDRLASLKTQLEVDGDQLADDEKEAIQNEINQLENELNEACNKKLNESNLNPDIINVANVMGVDVEDIKYPEILSRLLDEYPYEDLNENKKLTELKKTTTNSDWKNYDMKILNYLVKKGGSATLSEIATEAGLPADDGQYVTFETLGKHIDSMADSRVAVSGSESDAGNQEVSLILDDGANDDVKGIQELKNKMDDQATDLEENKKLTEAIKGKTLEVIYTDKDGEEKTTHFKCDKEYELDGEQIREAIKSSNNDIVDIIKINESKCLTEDDDHEEDEEVEKEETLEEIINRAYEEELSAINTYDLVLSKIENEKSNEKLIEMINEIKKDEEDHKSLIKHYIETGEALTDDELEELKNSKESNEDENEDNSEEEEEEVSIENIDDETFTEAFTKFIKENYKNAKEFKLENVIKSGNKYKFECKLTFNSGKQVKVNLMSEAKIREGKSLIRFYENKTFKHLDENKSIMTATVKLENKTLSCEALRYNYRVALKENKIATIKGIIK